MAKKKSERKRKGPAQIKPLMAGFFQSVSKKTNRQRKNEERDKSFTGRLFKRGNEKEDT